MAHDEAPVGQFRVDRIVLETADEADATAPLGMVKLSGSKMWFANGSTWELVTSV